MVITPSNVEQPYLEAPLICLYGGRKSVLPACRFQSRSEGTEFPCAKSGDVGRLKVKAEDAQSQRNAKNKFAI